ncbi:MAG TPA: hypothetical protein VHB97_06480 [Polyangia bacterium]|nr:hypothetical protein [Polyangia bacterium]
MTWYCPLADPMLGCKRTRSGLPSPSASKAVSSIRVPKFEIGGVPLNVNIVPPGLRNVATPPPSSSAKRSGLLSPLKSAAPTRLYDAPLFLLV